MELRQQIQDYIKEVKTKEALNLLENQEGLPKLFHNDITILQGRLEKLKKDQLLGIITYEKAGVEQSKLNLDILNLTSDIVKHQNAPKRSLKNLFRKPALRTPETNDFDNEADNIRQKLLERYEHRLEQKNDNRLPVELELTYTKEGTSPDYLHFDKDIISEKLQGDLVDTLKKHRHLLIVGKPGAGKTTQLLELAKAWLSDTANEQIPVIFNLSAWKTDDRYLHDWLQAALVSGYGFSPSLAKEAMDKQQIIPLLDGLDEVGKDKADDSEQTDLRNQCLDAISKYLTLYNTPYLAICSRIKEFAAADDAPVKAEILVNPLTPQAIKRTLKAALTKTQEVNNETAATTLLDLLPKHSVLKDILCTPFYYNIALDVFDDRTAKHDLPQAQADLELYLIEQFIDKKLDATDNPRRFSEERTRDSLAWVADVLERESWVSFELVDFQRRHLNNERRMESIFGWMFGLLLGSLLSFILGLKAAMLGFVGGVLAGLMFRAGRSLGTLEVKPDEIREIKWLNVLKLSTWTHAISLSLAFGIFLGTVTYELKFWIGVICGGLTIGLITGLVGKILVVKTFSSIKPPYHRLKSDIFFKVVQYTLTIVLAIFVGLLIKGDFKIKSIYKTLNVNFILAISFIVLLSFLLTSFSKHFMIRLALYLEKKMPLRWVSFFKYATSARILEQDGGQWRFRHQILQDYFAGRWRR